jgi:hypothetical protein
MLDVASDRVLLSNLSEQDYRNASFLDRRIITPQLQYQAVKWDVLDGVELPGSRPPHYIFHIGHVGSTLISRLLGESPDVLALREPQILRDLGDIYSKLDNPNAPWSVDKYQSRLNQVVSWLSRTFREDQRAMIKASSFVSNLADDLIGSENTSLFLYVGLESYLETILAGEGSRKEAEILAEFRHKQIAANLGVRIEGLDELTPVQKIALGWLSGMITLMKTYDKKDDDVIRWQGFNRFLKDPAHELTEISHHFDIELADVDALISGPIMNRYSKDPNHAYSPDLRNQLLQQARTNYSNNIKATLNWVDALAKQYKLIDKIMNFVE